MKSNSLFHCMIGCVKALTKYLEIYFKFVNFLRSEIGTCLFLRGILRLNRYIFIQYKCVLTIWTDTFTNFLWNTLSGQLYGQLIRGNKLCKLCVLSRTAKTLYLQFCFLVLLKIKELFTWKQSSAISWRQANWTYSSFLSKLYFNIRISATERAALHQSGIFKAFLGENVSPAGL